MPHRLRLSPPAGVALVVVGALAAWGSLAYAASVPHFFLDEFYYMKAGVSFGEGHGLQFRGQGWGYGPLFPMLIGATVRLTANQEVAYAAVKVLDAAAFALAAVPIYLLARRLLTPWPSVAIAAGSVALPSSMYVSVVMTESSSYLLSSLALYAIARALEHPSTGRQALAVAVTGLGIAARPQFVAIFAGYLLGLVLVIVIRSRSSARLSSQLLALWPSALSLILGLAWLLRPLLRGHGVASSLGSYSALAQSYSPVRVLEWFSYHVGDLALYLAVVPIVVAPCVLSRASVHGRGGSERDAAFVALFTAMNLTGIGLVAAFASTTFGLGLLYDRYLFYLIPLWLIVIALWLRDGLPRPPRALAIGGAAAIATVATLPFGTIGREDWFAQFEATSTEMWGKVGLVAARLPVVTTRLLGTLFAVALVALVARVPKRYGWVVIAPIAIVFASNLVLSWRGAFVPAAAYGSAGAGTRDWVDAKVGTDADVVLLAGATCPGVSTSELLTEFFNRSVRTTSVISTPGAPGSLAVRDGMVVDRVSGEAVQPPYVVTEPRIRVAGTRIAQGMTTGLVLWRVDPPVRLENVRSGAELRRLPCSG